MYYLFIETFFDTLHPNFCYEYEYEYEYEYDSKYISYREMIQNETDLCCCGLFSSVHQFMWYINPKIYDKNVTN